MKTVAIVAKGKNTCDTLKEQLDRILGNRIRVVGHYVDDPLWTTIKADLIVASGKTAYAASAGKKPDCPIILARRTINYAGLDELFDLPPGTNILLVNDIFSAAEETISMLQALGVDHLNYHPYAPNVANYPEWHMAVTPGEVGLVPPCVRTVINIKTRIIDITTLTEILQYFSMLDEKASLISASYISNIIRLIKAGKQGNRVINRTKTQLEAVINNVHDGIIAVDEQNAVTVFNHVAEQFFDLEARDVIGKNISEISDKRLKTVIFAYKPGKDAFIRIGAHHVVLNAAAISPNTPEEGTIYTLKDVSEIQKVEADLRRKLVSNLHVAHYTLDSLYGKSALIKKAVATARKLAMSDAPVLLQGESGTGKELLAQGMHNASPRKHQPFIAINFAAMTESLLESELFGYEEGAFTGARRGGASGLFEQAHRGTLFIDEIGDAPLSFQIKLLRVIQEKQVRHIGGTQLIPIDVRIISATHQDLPDLISRGAFRQDLYYRINVLPLSLPPLRARQEDILMIAKAFYDKFSDSKQLNIPADDYFSLIAPILNAYHWPGNARELQNVVEYLVNISPDEIPVPALLPIQFQEKTALLSLPDHSALKDRIVDAIAMYDRQKRSIGRRSLAKILNVPESLVRKTLSELQRDGAIFIGRGRSGLHLTNLV